MLPLENLLFCWPFLQKKYLISNKMSKIAELTCKIMRKFFFPRTVAPMYVYNTLFTSEAFLCHL